MKVAPSLLLALACAGLFGAAVALQRERVVRTRAGRAVISDVWGHMEQHEEVQASVESLVEGLTAGGAERLTVESALEKTERIINGDIVESIRMFPSVVSLIEFNSDTNRYRTFCTGSIIDDKIVMTAAHCVNTLNVKNPSSGVTYLVCSGTADVYGDGMRATCASITQAWVPMTFDEEKFYQGSDMALLKLRKSVINRRSKRAKVSFTKPQNASPAISVGFGKTDFHGIGDGKLRYLKTRIFLNEGQCDYLRSYKLDNIPALICSDATTAKGPGGTTCKGDSGGPLIVQGAKPSDQYIVGILSFGRTGCPISSESVYTSLYWRDNAKLFRIVVRKVLKGTFLKYHPQ